ncbi:TPA: EexN family lipoprotein [Enterobacter kobei]|nr:EexN family lipoprotein [Enterobacter kobei]
MKSIICFLTLSILFLSGCDEQPKSTEWYKDHPKEMNEKYGECKISGNDTPDCRNAISAYKRTRALEKLESLINTK